VDSYLREVWQPHVTQLEQSQLPEGQRQFWSDFEGDPIQTTLALLGEQFETDDAGDVVLGLAEAIYGPEAVDYFEAAIGHIDGEGDDGDEYEDLGYDEGDEGDAGADLPDEVRETLEWAQQQRAQQDEESELAEYQYAVKELHAQNAEAFPPGTTPEKASELLAPFVFTHDGDIDAALESFKQWTGALQSGAATGEEAAAASAAGLTPQDLAAPSALGGGPQAAPPTQQQYGSIGEAAADFARELRAKNAPPTV
jgi:hypothetical protein